MRKVTILKTFRDRDAFNTIYRPGEIRQFDDDRAEALTALGLVEVQEEKGSENPSPQAVEIPFAETTVAEEKTEAGVETSLFEVAETGAPEVAEEAGTAAKPGGRGQKSRRKTT